MANEQLALTGIPPASAENGTAALMRIIEKAAFEKDFSPETLKTLLDVKERWEASEAKKAYDFAMTRFKANAPSITKNKHVKFTTSKGTVEYDHATLDHICDELLPELSAYGFSHRYEVRQSAIEVDVVPRDGKPDGKPQINLSQIITVTCILTHERGHSESTTMQGLPDDSGVKNSIQAVGSTVTYLQRYTLLAATGLAAAGEDNDGGGAFKMPDVKGRIEEISKAQDVRALKNIFEAHYAAAKKEQDGKAMLAFIAAKDGVRWA